VREGGGGLLPSNIANTGYRLKTKTIFNTGEGRAKKDKKERTSAVRPVIYEGKMRNRTDTGKKKKCW
jgi:hypothetical protein